jgi:hypothetical protein
MKKIPFLLFFAGLCWNIAAQRGGDVEVTTSQKYALVIGNGNYPYINKSLKNPRNDAYDMNVALRDIGWNVEIVIDGNKAQIESALTRLRNRLSASRSSYSFLYYAGHAVQRDGKNYLIPVDIRQEDGSKLKELSVSVQDFLAELNKTENELNIVVLDACRDDPFRDDPFKNNSGDGRSITDRNYDPVNEKRGLVPIEHPPTNSIIVFATEEGSIANDGDGRNGLYTSHLLNNLRIPGIEVKDLFSNTNAAVYEASLRQQKPAIYSKIYQLKPFYIGPAPPPIPQNVRTGTPGTDNVTLNWDSAGSGISYKVYYNTQNDPARANALPNPEKGTSTKISGLASGTAYYFWVTSLLNRQESARSTTVSVRTAEASIVKTYKIGDRGPGGGIVYYISDDGQNGKEVADLNIRRTYMLFLMFDDIGNYRGGGFKDWGWPKLEECELITRSGIGSKLSRGRYWTWSRTTGFWQDVFEFARWYDFREKRTGTLPYGFENLFYRVVAYRSF